MAASHVAKQMSAWWIFKDMQYSLSHSQSSPKPHSLRLTSSHMNHTHTRTHTHTHTHTHTYYRTLFILSNCVYILIFLYLQAVSVCYRQTNIVWCAFTAVTLFVRCVVEGKGGEWRAREGRRGEGRLKEGRQEEGRGGSVPSCASRSMQTPTRPTPSHTNHTHVYATELCVYRHLPVLVGFLCKCLLLTDQHCLVCICRWDSISEVCYRRGGEGRGVPTLCVLWSAAFLLQAYRGKGKSHFNFLDWIFKLVWDLFPYTLLLH